MQIVEERVVHAVCALFHRPEGNVTTMILNMLNKNATAYHLHSALARGSD